MGFNFRKLSAQRTPFFTSLTLNIIFHQLLTKLYKSIFECVIALREKVYREFCNGDYSILMAYIFKFVFSLLP